MCGADHLVLTPTLQQLLLPLLHPDELLETMLLLAEARSLMKIRKVSISLVRRGRQVLKVLNAHRQDFLAHTVKLSACLFQGLDELA